MTKQKRKTCVKCQRKLVVSKMVEVYHRSNRWSYSTRDMSEWVCKKCLPTWKKENKGNSWIDWPHVNKVSAEISKDTQKKPVKNPKTK